MTKDQIKAELRREAMEEQPMFANLKQNAADAAIDFLPQRCSYQWDNAGNKKRTFFLLVAEAL